MTKDESFFYPGDSPVSATRFMVAADGWLVNNDMTKFTSALAMMFACQFNLNTKYAPDASATMDLFQRYFLKINECAWFVDFSVVAQCAYFYSKCCPLPLALYYPVL